MQPLLVGARTTTGRSPPFVEYKESPPQARMSELVGGLAIRLGKLLLQRQDARHDTSCRVRTVVWCVARDDAGDGASKAACTCDILVVAEEVRTAVEVIDVEVRCRVLRLDVVARAFAPLIAGLLDDGLSEAWAGVNDLDEVEGLLEADRETRAEAITDTQLLPFGEW